MPTSLKSLTSPMSSPSLLLARRTIRKHPGMAGAVLILSLIAGLLINVGLVMMTQHGAYLNHKAEEWNSPDAVILMPRSEQADDVEDALRSDERVRELETAPGVGVQGSIPYADSTLPLRFLFYDIDTSPQMGHWDIASALDDPVENPIWVPATLQAVGGYELGDALVLTSPMGERTFHIQGFTESTYGGMPSIGVLWFGLPGEDYAALEAEAQEHMAGLQAELAASGRDSAADSQTQQTQQTQPPGWMPSTLIKVQTRSTDETSGLTGEVISRLDITSAWDMDREILSMSNQISVGLISVVILLFSSMIAAVALLTLAFMLRGAIRDDLAAVGALRATGFTTGGVMRPMVLSFALLGALGAAVGAALSHAVFPHLSSVLRAQTGISWKAHVDPGFLLACAAGLGLMIWLGGALVARSAGRMSAVEALRGGQEDHSFTRVRLPLQRTRGPLAMLLGLKEMLAAPGRAVLVLVVAAACTTASVFSASGLGMLAIKDNALSLLLGSVFADVTVTAQSPDDVDAAVDKARDIPGVATAIPYSQQVETVDGTNIVFFVVDDVEDLPISPVYEGRPAHHTNEIVLGPGVEKRFAVHTGDTWTAKRNGIEKDFLVTGLASGAPNIGNFAILTRAAYQELAPDARLTNVGVFVTSADDSGTVSKALQDELGSEFQVVNTRDSMAVQMGSYLSVIPLLSTSLMAFNGFVVVLVVALMTSSLVAQSRRTAGLLKALGMTTRQAATRVRWTILPPLVLGTVLGCAVGGALIRPLLEVLLSGVGIKQITVDIPQWPTLAVGAAVLLTAVAAVFLSTRPLGKVTAYSLLAE
jgi:hypothetical protein